MVSIGFGSGEAPPLIVICGAVLASLLEAALTVMMIGRSPVFTVAGKLKVTKSTPGVSLAELPLAVITVVPTVTVMVEASAPRRPVTDARRTVAT